MNHHLNPFLRGYRNLRISRSACVGFKDGSPHVWRPIHGSQAHLSDKDLISSPCIVTNSFVVITDGSEPMSDELEADCDMAEGVTGEGFIGAVVYPILGDDLNGRHVYICDTHSIDAARELVQRLSFEPGRYSRCWEISRAHIEADARNYLAGLVDLGTPDAFRFTAFRIPPSDAIGVKLNATPWSNKALELAEGVTPQQLRRTFHDRGMPDDLARILLLAGQADVRILIFDASAPALPDLPLA